MSASANLELLLPELVINRTPFIITVEVRHAPPGQCVTLTLEQKRGDRPFWPAQTALRTADEGGVASACFSVVLARPGHAVFVATAYDRDGTWYGPDGDVLQVL